MQQYGWRCVMVLVFFLSCVSYATAETAAAATKSVSTSAPAQPGFLIIAPDRGFLGNEEVRAVAEEFGKAYSAKLVFIALGEDYTSQVKQKLDQAVTQLKGAGAQAITVLPLMLSSEDPHMTHAKTLLGITAAISHKVSYESIATAVQGIPVRLAPTMATSPLIAQILEDQARALSQDPSKERLILAGWGASSVEEATAMTQDLLTLAGQVGLPFADMQATVFYNWKAQQTVATRGNKEAKASIQGWASDQNLNAILIPVFGWKHTGSMQFSNRLASTVHGLPVGYSGHELFPHPNILRWLKKIANRSVAPTYDELGVVIMPHGGGAYHNEPILDAIAPLKERYPIEIAFGMADHETLQTAIDKLETKGIRHILVLRLYDSSRSLKDATEYVLGLEPTTTSPMRMHLKPVSSSAILYTQGGWDADPLISQVLLERVREISTDPAKETVILLAHGSGSDEKDAFWLKQVQTHADYIQAKSPTPFKAVRAATLREDWPEKRKLAVEAIRSMVAEAGKAGGKVLVISDRIAGPGPIRKFLDGLEFTFNGKGIAPHPNLRTWVERQINQWTEQVRVTTQTSSQGGT